MTPTVAVLAGGRGSRIGGDKALVLFTGEPLIEHSLRCAYGAGLDVCVVAKRDTRLPPMDVPIVREPDQPSHPLCGIVTALRIHPAIIALPCDMPLLPASVLTRLAGSEAGVMLAAPGEPFPALYTRAVLPVLDRALVEQASLRSVLAGLDASALEGIDTRLLLSVNTRQDLAIAQRRLDAERQAGGP
jgi:molybdopterin-guanine dinucleotide biosynthesis protein A